MSTNPQRLWYDLMRRLGRGPNLRTLDPEEAFAEYVAAPRLPPPQLTRNIENEPVDVPQAGGTTSRMSAGTEPLVKTAKSGSATATGELYRCYRAMLVAQVQACIPGLARRRVDIEDLIQTALTRVCESMDSFEYRSEGSFRRWLATRVVRTVLDDLGSRRSERGRLRDALAAVCRATDDTETPGAGDPTRGIMLEALGNMHEEDRDVLIQHLIENLSLHQIARIQGCPTEQARRLCERALSRLNRQLSR